MMKFDSAETAAQYVKENISNQPDFSLAISDNFTFAGRADTIGEGMAVVMDAILGKDYWPDGFEQKEGYRLYRYKRGR